MKGREEREANEDANRWQTVDRRSFLAVVVAATSGWSKYTDDNELRAYGYGGVAKKDRFVDESPRETRNTDASSSSSSQGFGVHRYGGLREKE